MKSLLRTLFGLCVLTSPMAYGSQPVLTLQDYLKQISEQNETYRSNILMMSALKLREAEASWDFVPQLTGNYSYTDDRRLLTEVLYGGKTVSQSAQLGVQTKFRTGTQLNFSYGLSFGTIYQGLTIPGSTGFSFPFPITSGYYQASPQLTLTQPLWKDFGAALSKANEEAQLASDRAQAANQRFSGQQVEFNGETSYWRLTLDREIVTFDKDSIDRTNKILIRNRKRVEMNVADRSDLLQSQAALQAKELQYQNDLEDLRTAANTFNSLRNMKGDQVPENLQPIDTYLAKNLSIELKQKAKRADVIAAEENAKSIKAQSKVSMEQVKPDISIFGTAQFTGMGATAGYAAGESWNADNPEYSAGLKLTIPMDLSAVQKINEGYEASAQAADLIAARAQFDLEQDWNNLQKQFRDALYRLQMAKDLEALQTEKLKHERDRFAAGRTTSFQVLQFEEDFSQAQLALLRVENELVTLGAQARLYNGEAL